MTIQVNFRRVISSLGWILPVTLLLVLRAFIPWDLWLQPFLAWLGQTGTIGIVVAIFLYVLLGIMLVPASALTIVMGVAHGFWTGLFCATLGANLAAWAAFGLARCAIVTRVKPESTKDHLLARINEQGARAGIWLVLLARLSIFIPFGPLNYLMGFSKVSFMDYALGTFLGMLPGSALYLWAGSALGRERGEDFGAARTLLVAIGLVSMGLLLALVGRIAHQTIALGKKRTANSNSKNDGQGQPGLGAASNSAITTS